MGKESKIERRSYAVRASQGDEFSLIGRALTYNEISSNELMPGMRERVLPGAFRESLAAGRDIKALLNHDSSALPLGRTGNGTLQIVDGQDGLDFKIQLDRSNSFHAQVYASVKRQDLAACSFAFICQDEDYSDGIYGGQACQIRSIRKADLLDVSAVNSPFYDDGATAVQARAAGTSAASALLAKVLALPGDWARQERAAAIGKQIMADLFPKTEQQRGNQDWFADRCREACSAMGLDFCAADNDSIFASDPASENEEDCCRFAYEIDPETGEPLMDNASRTVVKHEISHSARCAKREHKRLKDLRFRMEAANGLR